MIERDRLVDYAREHLIAKEKYERAVRINIRSSLPMADKKVFWRAIQDLSGLVQFNHRRAIHEFFIRIFRGEYELFGMDDIPSFILTYGRLKNGLAKVLKDFDYLGDNLSDAVDSLPLAGKNACLRILAGEVIDMEKFNSIIKDNFIEETLEQVYCEVLADWLASDDEGADEFTLNMENADP